MPHHHPQIQHDTAQIGTLPDADRLSAADRWQHLFDAGLIGTRLPRARSHHSPRATNPALAH